MLLSLDFAKETSVPTTDELIHSARTHWNAGDFSGVVALCQQVLALDAENFAAHWLFAAASNGLGHSDQAIASMTKALQLAPDRADVNHFLGVMLANQGRLDEAARYCQRALELKPDYVDACDNLARIRANQGDHRDAAQYSRRALVLAVNSLDAERAYAALLQYLELSKTLLPPEVKLLLAGTASKDHHVLSQIEWLMRGFEKSEEWRAPEAVDKAPTRSNALEEYFDAHREGPGIWKWRHYFEIYDRHFRRFQQQEVHILEIGIYSGGSLGMWKNYFGPKTHVYGVDIEPACKVYEDDATRIFIGDQADPDFWRRFRAEVPVLDIVIDDGGHTPQQQMVTLEGLLGHLRPGGVFLCEDILGPFNPFTSYVHGMMHELARGTELTEDMTDPERRLTSRTSGFQSVIHAIHSYPWVTVIEKRSSPLPELVSPKHGTQWQPFLS